MYADKLLTALFNAGVAVSIIATVLSLGMSFTVAQVLAPLRRVVPVILMIAVNCLLIPAAAWGLFTVFGIKDAYVSGATLAPPSSEEGVTLAGLVASFGTSDRVIAGRSVPA